MGGEGVDWGGSSGVVGSVRGYGGGVGCSGSGGGDVSNEAGVVWKAVNSRVVILARPVTCSDGVGE